MKVVHELEITAICPVDSKPDVYSCTVTANRVIPVESIPAEANKVKSLEVYQEDLCQELHRVLACRVELIGYHSGVKTTVVCGGDD